MEDNRYKRTWLVPFSTVTTVKYQCGRLLNRTPIVPMFDNHETRDLYTVILSTQLQIVATKRKGVITDDIPLQSRHDSEIH